MAAWQSGRLAVSGSGLGPVGLPGAESARDSALICQARAHELLPQITGQCPAPTVSDDALASLQDEYTVTNEYKTEKRFVLPGANTISYDLKL